MSARALRLLSRRLLRRVRVHGGRAHVRSWSLRIPCITPNMRHLLSNPLPLIEPPRRLLPPLLDCILGAQLVLRIAHKMIALHIPECPTGCCRSRDRCESRERRRGGGLRCAFAATFNAVRRLRRLRRSAACTGIFRSRRSHAAPIGHIDSDPWPADADGETPKETRIINAQVA